jgi:MFS family permease
MSTESKKSSILIEVIIFVLFALGPLTGNVILVLFGVLSLDFSVIPNAILIAIPSFMFPFAIVQLFSGAISDIKGRFPVILLGLVIFGVGMIIASFSFSLQVYIIANILGGIGFGFVNPVLIALLTDITPGPKVSKKIGFLGAFANLGVGLGPLLAGQVIQIENGWRYLYIIFLGITVLGIIVIFTIRKNQENIRSNVGFRMFLSHLSQEIRRIPVILLVISAFLLANSYIATIIWTSRSFTHVISEMILGLVIALFGIMGFIGGILTGLIIKKKDVKTALMMGLISLFIANLILILFGTNTFEALIPISMGLIFMGFAGGTLTTIIMFFSQTLSKERRGALAGLTTALQFIGIAFVPMSFEFFYNTGGISLVYLVILFISVIFLIVLILLYIFAKKVPK